MRVNESCNKMEGSIKKLETSFNQPLVQVVKKEYKNYKTQTKKRLTSKSPSPVSNRQMNIKVNLRGFRKKAQDTSWKRVRSPVPLSTFNLNSLSLCAKKMLGSY
ncbi:unnamed protein product [Moneuplotes crassus]|uniref:Uncharacterized protein n=1 Tax=Euplotes crassus TaxID=5936 RepID=A0AAD1Y8A5_EUPCR|nr:unnamed protein product [Moneuplotes crassus]